MPLGRRGPGLVGMAARTAVVVGTANAVSNKQQQKYANQAAAQQEAAAEQATPAAPAAAPQDDLAAQLESLAKLRDQGILTEEEFSAKKAQILGI
ncbi:MAG: SHOCT domain-containing protein [Actinobacteria bacterium]|nr:SHOCT domain-containing protein [Actinomycetota bacterium]